MTKLTDEAVKALLDGATPGPWRADGEPWNRVVWSPNGNRVCFMAHSSGLDDARDTATSNLVAAAHDLARALLDARAELARVRADAAVAVALMVERAADEINLRRHLLANVQNVVIPKPEELAIYDICEEAIRALAPADGLAAVEALRVERDYWKQMLEKAEECLASANSIKNVIAAERDTLAAENASLKAAKAVAG